METTGAQNQATPQNGPTNSGGTGHQVQKTPTSNQPGGPNPGGNGNGSPSHSESAVAQAAAEAKRKLKIDNEEVDEEEVIKTYKERKGHQRTANQTLQEGLKAKKQAEEFLKLMKDKGTLVSTLEKLGYKKEDLRELSEKFLAGVLEEEMLDPREKELRATKTKLQQYQELEKKQKEEQEKQRDAEMKKKFADDYTKEFVEALKTTNLPPTKAMVAEMAKYIHKAAKIGFQMTAAEAAKLVREDVETHYRHLYGASDPETLVKLVGEEGLKKIREYDTKRLKDPNSVLQTPEIQGERKQNRDGKQRMTPEEWRKFNRGG